MKKISYLFVVLLIFNIFATTSVFATESEWASGRCDVYDHAEVLSKTDESILLKLGEDFANKYNLDIVFLTTYNTHNKSSMTYSDDFYDGIEGPVKYRENGIIFFIDLDNDMNYVGTSGSAIAEISDSEVDAILDAAAKADLTDYYGCFFNMLTKAESCYKYSSLVSFVIADTIPVSLPILIVSIIISIVIAIIFINIHNSANAQIDAGRYVEKDNLEINVGNRAFIHSFEKVHHGYYSSKNSGGSSHRSSSGRSHGGGGRSR